MAQPGTAAQVLCFRHSFLRDLAPAVPSKPPIDTVMAYPFRFLPGTLTRTSLAAWRYEPQNLDFDYERYEWAKKAERDVHAWCDRISDDIVNIFVPWVEAFTPERAAIEMRQRGEDAWCERNWLEDYAAHAAAARFG